MKRPYVVSLVLMLLVIIVAAGCGNAVTEEQDIGACKRVMEAYAEENMGVNADGTWIENIQISDDGKTASAYMGVYYYLDEDNEHTDEKSDAASTIATCDIIEAEEQDGSWTVTSCEAGDPDDLKSFPVQ